MDEHYRRPQSESEDGAVTDNFMPIQRMGSRNFKRHKSRSRSRNGSTSPHKMGRYTPPLTNGRTSPMKNRHSKDIPADEPISILDPRRFTPTLHASLVAEILSLRRDLEAKSGLIESLETDLSIARAETENTATTAASARREARDVREQLKLKENDEALESLSYERDQALETVAELKRQVERLTKSRRKAEDDIERDRRIFDRERSEWELSKRSLEHRVHVAEGRLKTLLQEIASANEANQQAQEINGDEAYENHLMRPESIARPVSRNSMRSISSSGSEDTDAEKLGIRFSMINSEASQSALRLADELDFIHETSEASEAETEGSVYPESVGEMAQDTIPAPEEEYEFEAINEHLIPSRRSSGALSPSIIGDDKSEMTECTVLAATNDEIEIQDLRRDNKRMMEMVEQLEECIRLEKQERENIKNTMTEELADWKVKYEQQTQVYEAREYEGRQERLVLQREHQGQLELLESIAADTQHQLELLASEKADLKRSMEEASRRAREAELEEEDHPLVASVLEEIIDECVFVEALPPIEEMDEPAIELIKPLETPRNSLVLQDDCVPQSPREISANQGRKRISLMGPVSPPLSPPSTITRRSSAVIYVSSDCQTSPVVFTEPGVDMECQTTPIVIAEQGVDAGCQTDKPPSPPQSPTFIIPSITIHPPGPAIISYEPKPTRSIACQTTQPPKSKSTSMQTEVIKVDTRILNKNFGSPPPQRGLPKPPVPVAIAAPATRPPTAVAPRPTTAVSPRPPTAVAPRPTAVAPRSPAPAPIRTQPGVPVSPPPMTSPPMVSPPMISPPMLSPTTTISSPPVPPAKSTRRGGRVPLARLNTAPGPVAAREIMESPPQSSPPRRSMSEAAIPHLPMVSPNGVYRPPRTTSLWKYGDMPSDEDDDEMDIEEQEDMFGTALSAPRPPRPRPSESTIASIASNRDSMMLPKRHPSVKRNMATGKPILPARAWGHSVPGGPRRIPGIPVGPPYPVPLRHSSRKLPPSITSSRASSPSPMSGGIRRTRNSVRKSRSALGLSQPQNGSIRTRSPPPMSSFSSITPESPMDIPPLPRDTILPNSANRPNYGHRYQDSSVTGTASIDSSQQQTSVVDAIAQTMVGEFLYKYVRKRFGQQETLEKDDGGSGVRHKRWVWVAPYERAVMWSTRQPTSGSALMGKSGRKLLIQSVLDVKDESPPPKGVTLFNRSILILTPARALKFTAGTQERHYIWLMALSFLAHSSQTPANGLTLPPALPFEYEQLANRSETESKGKEKATAPSFVSGGESEFYDARPTFQNPFSARGSFTTSHSYAHSNGYSNGYSNTYSNSNGTIEDIYGVPNRRNSRYGSIVSDDSVADYPTVRRHARKRSNTAYPRMPPPRNFTSPTFSGFSGNHRPSDSINSDFNCNIPMYHGNQGNDRNSMISYQQSIRDGAGSAAGNFFDAIPNNGTMRMEAFISATPKIGGYEDDDFFPDLSRAFQSGRSSNRNSRAFAAARNGFIDAYGISDDPYSISRGRYSEDDDGSYHQRKDLFAGF
ncbi:hypothetical protein TWF192_005013 [Orbilia oligospora]|uniref:Pleckstrin homology domain-containing protein n=1 Tax=Orbilia oligospora TaxID=2813651 RepID=A0A6G1MA28_ORBOL|nr:hypothetical protein TWF679_002935 [Orbilia oligospora]KAF3214928.1 hypothetical protein TWF191_009619 [Orbilia oligospora]KAF3251035.1 hypothetical protein TWF192_005013 [Orbilia oligospora]